MAAQIHPLAGHPAPPSMLIDVAKLVSAYHTDKPDPTIAAQRVAFGTSGHRGSAFDRSFNEWHVLAITQAICHHRKAQGIAGPLFMGIDTHALSAPACASALEVLAANGVESIISHVPGNGERIGGIKVNTTNGWFAARPSGTEDIYKIYAESFVGAVHLQRVLQEAQAIVDAAISRAPAP